MTIRRVTVLIAIATAAVIMVPQAVAAKKPPKLKATFGAGLTFDVKRGKKVLATGSDGEMTVKAGKFRFQVVDGSTAHNFRLQNANGETIKGKRGKKRQKVLTSVSGTLKKPRTYVVRLKKGEYTLICDPHKTVGMTVTITVT